MIDKETLRRGWNRDCVNCQAGIKPAIKKLSDVKCNTCIGFDRTSGRKK